MRELKKTYIFLFLLIINLVVIGQSKTIDSLETVIQKTKEDTIKFKLKYKIILEYRALKEIDSAISKSHDLINLANKIGNKKIIKDSYFISSRNYANNKEPDKAIEVFNEYLLKVDENDSLERGQVANILGLLMVEKGDVVSSINYFLKSESYLMENIKALEPLRNLGLVYGQIDDIDNAFFYNQKAIDLALKYENYPYLAKSYISQGFQYDQKNKKRESFYYALKAKDIYLNKMKDSNNVRLSIIYGNLADIYLYYYEVDIDSLPIIDSSFKDKEGLKKLASKKSEYYLKKAIEISEMYNKTYYICSAHNSYGEYYLLINEYAKALKEFHKAYESCEGNKSMLKNEVDITLNLYKVNKILKNKDKALFFHEKHLSLRDSLFSKEKQRELGEREASFKFEKQKAIEESQRIKEKAIEDAKAEQEKAIAKEQEKNQQIITYSIAFGLVMISIFSLLLFRRLRVARAQQVLIEKQKKAIEKNRNEMLESIEYSKNIQQRIFPTIEEIENLLPNSVLFFRPKDVVSGDFHWAYKKGNKTYFSVADCTGHGVPGAFMTLISLNIINSIIIEENINSTATLLEHLHYRLKEKLSDSEDGKVKHGLDIAMCAYNHDTKELEFSGLHNPIYIINSENKLKEVKGDNLFLGISNNFKVTSHKFKIEKGDSVYMSTDGFPDQKGGEKGKKYYYSRLRNLLRIVDTKPVEERRVILNQKFEDWKGDKEQIDDVCIMGVSFED